MQASEIEIGMLVSIGKSKLDWKVLTKPVESSRDGVNWQPAVIVVSGNTTVHRTVPVSSLRPWTPR